MRQEEDNKQEPSSSRRSVKDDSNLNEPKKDEKQEERVMIEIDEGENVTISPTADSVEEEIESSSSSSSSFIHSSSAFFLGYKQLMALLQKNFKYKVRTPIPTFFELFSPMMMVLILVAAYTLSEVTYKDAKDYSTIVYNVTSLPVDAIANALDLIYDNYDGTNDDGTTKLNAGRFLYRSLQQDLEYDDDDDVESNVKNDDDYDTFTALDEVRKQISGLLAGPIEVPTFDQYIYISTLLSSALDSEQMPTVLSDSQYIRKFGNLLTLGTIHLSPESNTMTNEFSNYLTAKYPNLIVPTETGNIYNDTSSNSNTSVNWPKEKVKLRIHRDENSALKFINDNLDEHTWALIDFPSAYTNGRNEEINHTQKSSSDSALYKIRMNHTTLPNTNEIISYAGSIGLNKQYQKYYLSGFLTIQQTINRFMFSRVENNKNMKDGNVTTANSDNSSIVPVCSRNSTTLFSMPMPTASYSQNQFYTSVGYLLGLTFAMAFMYPVSRLIKLLVEEKEMQMRELLFILGVKPFVHWLSWVVTSLLMFLIIGLLVSVVLCSQILKHSSAVYIFVYIYLFCTATIGFSFFISAFFTKSKLASIIGPVSLFATLLPRFIFFGSNRYEATTAKYIASLLPCTAFAFGADIIADYEYSEQGVHSYNVSQDDYSFRTALGFLLIDTFIYMFLGWYLDQVLPRKYGVRRKWYFLLLPNWWCSAKRVLSSFFYSSGNRVAPKGTTQLANQSNVNDEDQSSIGENNISDHHNPLNFEYVRDCDPTMIPRVQIKNLTKRYKKKDTNAAVDNMNLQLYESQITCLLGHNSAGKTSTLSVLTGMYPPTSGDCSVYGHSIVDDLQKARESMGVCPQKNILFDKLTVLEHLCFFEQIKGGLSSRTKTKLKDRGEEIGLGEFLDTTAYALSGGNKRKLCLAISLCGDPKFVLLDEPTSGMDPASRRLCWDLLRRKRIGRVTLLTTHFMDEADLLADRIAVMKEGKLQCVGSALFLKNRFGLGYSLTVAMNDGNDIDGNDLSQGIDPIRTGGGDIVASTQDVNLATSQSITEFLNYHIANTMLVRKSPRELTYRFPKGTEDLFPETLDQLQTNMKALGINSYGVSNTTLEEVFLQLGECDEKEKEVVGVVRESTTTVTNGPQATMKPENQYEGYVDDSNNASSSILEPVHMSPCLQVILLYKKRFLIQKRDVKGFFFMIILPVIIIALVLLVLTIDLKLDGNAIFMNLDLYDMSTEVLVGGGASPGYSEAARTSNDTKKSDISQLFIDLNSTIADQNKHVKFTYVVGANSSAVISQYLLDTIHNHDHSTRYGAFALRDSIDVIVSVDWGVMKDYIELFETTSIDRNAESVHLRDLLGLSRESDSPVRLQFRVSDVAGVFYNLTSLTPESAIHLNDDSDNEIVKIISEYFSAVSNNSTKELFRDASLTLGGPFGELNEILGGENQTLDAYFMVEFDSAIFNPSNMSFTLEGLAIKNLNYSADELTLTTDEVGILLSLLPNGTIEYEYAIDPDASVIHNTSSPHAVAAFNQAYMEYLYKTCTNSDAELTSVNHPLPLTAQQSLEVQFVLSVLATFFLLIPLCYILGAFIVFPVKERASQAKHLQLVSGVSMSAYWVSTYIFDATMYFLLSFIIMMVFLAFGSSSAAVFVGDFESFIATTLLIVGYGLSALPFAYLCSRYFDNHSSAQIAVMGIFFITGFVAVIAWYIMSEIEQTKHIAESLRPLFRTFPAYNVGEGLIRLAIAFWERMVLGLDRRPLDYNVAGQNILLLYVLFMPYFSILLLLEYSADGGSGGCLGRILRSIAVSYDNFLLKNVYGTSQVECGNGSPADEQYMDTDVLQERAQVINNKKRLEQEAPVVLVNMSKVYPPSVGMFGGWVSSARRLFERYVCSCCCPQQQKEKDRGKTNLPKIAVRGLTTSISEGETYGLLGVNGAGKTTTLGVLTGDVRPTGGEAYVAGFDVTGNSTTDVSEARKQIGYCPQVDPLIDLLTGRETLNMFARLRGIPNDEINHVVTTLLDDLTLTLHADKVTNTYSGGSKRKLALGIAMIGNPRVVFIDEASSGMDPCSRKKMWKLIDTYKNMHRRCNYSGTLGNKINHDINNKRPSSTIILTTHSMEEAESLCTRVGILAHGRLLCLGSVQHLKSKYLNGSYTIDVHCTEDSTDESVSSIADCIISSLSSSEVLLTEGSEIRLLERYGKFIKFSTASGGYGLGTIFRTLQQLRENPEMQVENFSISQCSLEQVFISLVSKKNGENDNDGDHSFAAGRDNNGN